MTRRRPVLALALAATGVSAASCETPPSTAIWFDIEPASTCQAAVAPIRTVRVSIIGARSGVECIEAARCVVLSSPASRIGDVQMRIPRDLSFELIASRGYQVEAIGYGTADCTVGGSFGNYRFCGQSDVLRFDQDATVRISAKCGLDVPDCAGLNASLRFCR